MSNEHDEGLTRRQAIGVGLVGAASLAALPAATAASSDERRKAGSQERMPVVFMPHGGGPWPFVELGFDKNDCDALADYLRSVRALPKTPPKALLVVSAHWEEPVPTVMTAERPPMYYDYYGFPPESYQLTWPAPGQPKLAARVQELLGAAGFQTAMDSKRGFDHGTFVPLKLTYPNADVPTVQLSLKQGLDPEEHLAMGRALAPLRDEGVFIVGSGMTFHNLRAFRDPRAPEIAEAFDGWLREAATLDAPERDRRLTQWSRAPAARLAHPREEHLLPLMVIAGAAGADRGTTAYSGKFMGVRLSAYHFGA
ncbi:DODA-type extradiol aromatic ring-opening family dioxygenase [Hyalangium gracile]|uniref:DODA-type extradiol aromatic ring-opening family dioxygenase n=1 Tax=Hyalangium gracile TaxID=394092 RepID=UPI001CCE24D9|nr:class III extradiol ring-cleavage dioxygenase [Hyalangium gracile]